jgi:hypothetical protein
LDHFVLVELLVHHHFQMVAEMKGNRLSGRAGFGTLPTMTEPGAWPDGRAERRATRCS